MIVYPVFLVVLALWLVVSLRRADDGFVLAIALLPFGMFAAVTLTSMGGLSVLASSLVAAMSIALMMVRKGTSPDVRGTTRFTSTTLAFGFFALYSAFSAVVLVRLFSGQFLVFSLSRSIQGARIDPNFASVLVPLRPGGSNLSQGFYIMLSFAFFLAFKDCLKRRGADFGARAMAIAAVVNIVLAAMDMAGLDEPLSLIRTASYTLANEQTMGPFGRVIGGFSEPSSFGAASATFFGYFTATYFATGRWSDLVLGALSAFCAIASFSATGLFAAGVAGLLIFVTAMPEIRRSPRLIFVMGMGVCLLTAALCVLLVATPLMDLVGDLFHRIFLAKADSMSGLERKAWALSGLNAFQETFGLGAGAGSLRSNGLLAVLLGSVGLPGTLAFAAFLWLSIGRRFRGDPLAAPLYQSARAGAVAQLAAAGISGTVPDPGLLLVTCCALAAMLNERIPTVLQSDRRAAPVLVPSSVTRRR